MLGSRASWVWLRVFFREMRVGGGSAASLVNQTLVFTIMSAMMISTIQPHQELRFLIPLLVPFVAYVPPLLPSSPRGLTLHADDMDNIQRLPNPLVGIFRQRGVIPSLLHVRTLLDKRSVGSEVRVVYSQTYMPSRQPLGVSQPG
ncbi:hypothetical protein JAAARDRAFT_196110 [Jaapia argillacea MUCL 33604]|uniref:Mannosyltransferase n=1 Tax=Jaapia argillacea MUCL 33604 TaxID=933084 RepID=A0A067PVF5_9AGAM|nr:hypothetical protein JAAARDRAFT_196110 [Jaapia argillacea MUCL 33604]